MHANDTGGKLDCISTDVAKRGPVQLDCAKPSHHDNGWHHYKMGKKSYIKLTVGNVNFVVNPQSPTQNKEKSEWSHRNDANDTEGKFNLLLYLLIV